MKTLAKQSLIDIAAQETGSVESIFDIAAANDLSLTDEIEAGYEAFVEDIIDAAVVICFIAENRKPASAISIEEINAIIGIGEGIGYMQIGYDFIVS